jgi:hypothetical protein
MFNTNHELTTMSIQPPTHATDSGNGRCENFQKCDNCEKRLILQDPLSFLHVRICIVIQYKIVFCVPDSGTYSMTIIVHLIQNLVKSQPAENCNKCKKCEKSEKCEKCDNFENLRNPPDPDRVDRPHASIAVRRPSVLSFSSSVLKYCTYVWRKIGAWCPRSARTRDFVNYRKKYSRIARVRRGLAGLTVYPPSRTLELLAFDEYCRFDTSA